jgi:proline iminopeptidase
MASSASSPPGKKKRKSAMSEFISKEGYIPVTGGRVWYRVVGTGSGLPLLALHGGPGANSGYLEPLTALADERPVIFYDQLGGGKSDRPNNPNLWVLDRFAEELMQVRDALNLTRFHLCGHSWGTMLAVEYALDQSVGLVSLILAGPVLSVPRYVQDANALKRELPCKVRETIEHLEVAGTTDTPEYQAASGEWMRRHLCRNEPILEGLLKGLGDPVSGINSQVYNTMQGPSEFAITGNLKDFDRTIPLSEIKVPTLFTCGRYDECTPGATAWYHSLMPGSEMIVIEQSAHMTHLEEPELYVQTARDFLHKVECRTSAST